MKKKILPHVLLQISSAIFFTGCVKDTCKDSYTYTLYRPVYETVSQLRANIKSGSPEEIENPGKIVILGHYIFLNEIEKGIHIIDNTNPAVPRNVSFVNIPGNMDLAAKGNTLYADSYADLVTMDVSDPTHVALKDYKENVLQFPYYASGIAYNPEYKIAAWEKKDTTIIENCGEGGVIALQSGAAYFANAGASASVPAANKSAVGTGGSMARFAIVNNYLYTVNNSDLNVFDITKSNDPAYISSTTVDFHVETIYPFGDKLFIGSNNGMFIYSLNSSPDHPVNVGQFTHARSCDPVISDGEYAYITLHSGSSCEGYNNELDVVRLNMLVDASLVQVYNLTSPEGLSKDGDLLFLCDGTDGLKVFDASDVLNMKLLQQFPIGNAYDVIAQNRIALVVTTDALYQFDYSDPANIHLLSKLSILKS
jgi:hypothetical protein